MTLFMALRDLGPATLHCAHISRSGSHSSFGFTFQTLPDCVLLVTNVQAPDIPLKVGDRILEINGVLLTQQSHASMTRSGGGTQVLLGRSESLSVVFVRQDVARTNEPEETNCSKLQEQVLLSKVKWQSLRQFLVCMHQRPFDQTSVTTNLLVGDLEDLKSEVSSEEKELQIVKKEKCVALDKLRATWSPESGFHQGDQTWKELYGYDYYEYNLKCLQSPRKIKTDVMKVLRELLQHLKCQSLCLDRLTTLVLSRAPWMLDELEARGEDCLHTHTHNHEDSEELTPILV